MTVFEKFKNITGLDIKGFLEGFQDYLTVEYQSVVRYYTGGEESLDKSAVSKLEDLRDRSNKISDAFTNYKYRLSETFEFWDLLNVFEEVKNKIDTIFNSAKWFRSNKTLYYNDQFEIEYRTKQGQSLIAAAGDLGYENPNNDWSELVLKNDLNEEDYGLEGGALLKVTYQNNLNVAINSVLGGISGESIYGLDFDKKTQFEVDGDGFIDLKILGYKETIKQAFEILLRIYKGSVPEFPQDGINKNIVGTNRNAIPFPVLFRELANVFGNDDSFKNFQTLSIDRSQDIVEMKVRAQTRIGETLNQSKLIG